MAPSDDAIRPPRLVAGARVALVAPAGPVDDERIRRSEDRCRALGFEPVLFPAARDREGFLAGSDSRRLADLQAAFDDPTIDAVWALRGGYGTLRIAGDLDLARQRRDPIPFIGFSDNTAIHARHVRLGVVSFHGPHPGGDFPPATEAALRRVLLDPDEGPVALDPGPDGPTPVGLGGGSVRAPLVGGNLAILAAMCGTGLQLPAHGRILFLEDVGEPAYRVDRMLWQLRAAGVTDGIAGLAFGRFSDAPDGERFPVDDVLTDFSDRVDVPAVKDLPFGHLIHNCTIPVGGMAELDGDRGRLVLG